MSKKLTAIVLTLIMLMSFSVIPAYAVDSQTAGPAFESAVEQAVGGIIGAASGDEIIADEEFVQALASDIKPGLIAKSLAKLVAKYVFVDTDLITDTDAAANKILSNSKYTVKKITGGKKTVYIVVDLQENPEICNLAIFQKVVKGLYANQNSVVADYEAENGNVKWNMMSYEHIAGELALHALVYNLTDSKGGSKKYNIFHPLWESAKQADLNVDELRIPSSLIRALGFIIMRAKNVAELIAG